LAQSGYCNDAHCRPPRPGFGGVEEPNWADLAYELGYSSQQHFITQFRQVLGKTPVQYWRDVRE
jgi:AraC-like DNA-binding protein